MPQTHLDQLDPRAADLATRSLAWMDRCWDATAGLFRAPGGAFYEDTPSAAAFLLRESAWYALGLLLRDGPGDRLRALRTLDGVLQYQLDAPGQPYHGTWYRSPHEPPPPPNPVIWRDYDPNWREFIGTTLAVILLEYEAWLPPELTARIDAALRRAITGTLARAVDPSYTNIALMAAFLLQFGADRFGEPSWSAAAEDLAAQVQLRFRANGTFDEYNSPTYYGVDLYALALWRSRSSSALLRAAGAELEAALWRDIAQFYHAALHNVAGPYDRSYGMDLRQYVASLGLWIWLATGYEQAPVPRVEAPFAHAWDFAAAPLFALLGLRMPADAQAHFDRFQGARHVERVIAAEPRRVASAWIDTRYMLGAEDSGSRYRVGDAQFHPVTIHWLTAADTVGWIKLGSAAPVDAWATPGRLEIVCSAHPGGALVLTFYVESPAIDPGAFQRTAWNLPGLRVDVETNADELQVERAAERIALHYRVRDVLPGAPIRFVLQVAAQ